MRGSERDALPPPYRPEMSRRSMTSSSELLLVLLAPTGRLRVLLERVLWRSSARSLRWSRTGMPAISSRDDEPDAVVVVV